MSVYMTYECDLCHTKCQSDPKGWRHCTIILEAATKSDSHLHRESKATLCPRCSVMLELVDRPDAEKLLGFAAEYFKPKAVSA